MFFSGKNKSGNKPTRLGDLLVERKIISADQLRIALDEQKRRRELLIHLDKDEHPVIPIGELLIELHFIKRRDLRRTLHWQHKLRKTTFAFALLAPLMSPMGAAASTSSETQTSTTVAEQQIADEQAITQNKKQWRKIKRLMKTDSVYWQANKKFWNPQYRNWRETNTWPDPTTYFSDFDKAIGISWEQLNNYHTSTGLGLAQSELVYEDPVAEVPPIGDPSTEDPIVEDPIVEDPDVEDPFPGPEASGSVSVSWVPPNVREDGTMMDWQEIAGYELQLKSPGTENYDILLIDDPNITDYMIVDLPPGEYELRMATKDTSGLASEYAVATFTVN